MQDYNSLNETPDLGSASSTKTQIADVAKTVGDTVSAGATEATEDLKMILGQAQSLWTETVDATASFIRERPIVATAVVGGIAVAATAGAAYGIQRYNSKGSGAAQLDPVGATPVRNSSFAS